MDKCCKKWIGQSVYVYRTNKHGWNECSTDCKYCPECGAELNDKEKE